MDKLSDVFKNTMRLKDLKGFFLKKKKLEKKKNSCLHSMVSLIKREKQTNLIGMN